MHGPATPSTSQIRYRRDIDGLRALAILPVLLFHAHVPGFSGGYVGVDIFFVISGYLITGIIAREVDERRFSLARFYERRFRRIMPALALMILIVLAAAAFLYLPGDLEGVPRSALAATLFASNLWFFTDTGYFSGGADVKPLLHTWSLAVEEQYYIGFPILLMLLARFAPHWRKVAVAGIAAGSLVLAIAMQRDTSGFTFYLLPTRAWELFAGALLALGAVPQIRPRWLRELIAWGGALAIACSVALYDRNTLFPGLTALPPVLGAAALIHAAPGTSMARLLSLPPLVGIGLISYSLYLWHWPLIVFTEYATDVPLSGATRILVIGAALAAAILSWRFVERPFRDSRRLPARAIFRFTGAAMALLCILSLALMAMGGWPARFAPQVLAQMAGQTDFAPTRKQCHDNFMRGATPCILGADVRPDAMLWGDSHGVELAYALSVRARTQGRSLIERTTSSCPPVLGYEAKDPRCAAANRAAFDAIRADPGIRRVYLAAFWANGDFDRPDFVAQLDSTIAALRAQGRQVVLIGPVPPQPFDVPRHLAHLAQAGRMDQAQGVARAFVEQRTTHLRAAFARWRRLGVPLIDTLAALCDTQHCAIERNGKPLYFDSHHLSVAGATLVAARDD
ncbi:Peptidoglycan/LPS O-acetylase OafA/YrhL, contains acyltransferase and SGNH-hydrolase domains [Sphingobium sp. AP50]|uniref:acyltransferase family protein n=1 Tax=Sphingobium sp. AP50 TaxID=1884369 RepID=UPI0008ACEF6F|nr:acyltransferase family protein [Sphingobium sp. AP50]SEJ76957.1 Peptidoglycan/LPS O-acetylase OafA/YrhL, contains acyltransferase and SGNH-hydrolase domains [Sphingobium sp. AP50]